MRDLFVKNKIVFVLCALFLMSGCKKEDSDNIPEVPKGNPNQIILTVNGTEITEDMTDAKLGAYLIYNPFAGEDDIRGARKTVALSIAEALLLDQKAAENETKTTAEEDAQTEILIEFVYKDKSRIEKAAAYKNIPISEMLRDNLIEYKKMKFLAGLPEAEKPTNAEIDQFVEENRKTFAEKPQRKIVFQILKRHDGTEKGKLRGGRAGERIPAYRVCPESGQDRGDRCHQGIGYGQDQRVAGFYQHRSISMLCERRPLPSPRHATIGRSS